MGHLLAKGCQTQIGMNDDAKNELTAVLVEYIKYFLPLTFSMENVMGLLKQSRGRRTILLQVISELLKVGYQVRLCIVLVSDYGYPHNRERVILLGAQKGHKLPDVPKATHGECPGLMRRVTVKEVLGDLDKIHQYQTVALWNSPMVDWCGTTA